MKTGYRPLAGVPAGALIKMLAVAKDADGPNGEILVNGMPVGQAVRVWLS